MVAVPDDVNVSGNCSYTATSQEITLAFFNSTWMLNIVVAKGGKSNVQNAKLFQVLSDTADYSWQSVSVTYKVDDHFPGANNAGKCNSYLFSLMLFMYNHHIPDSVKMVMHGRAYFSM
jgi:hypothetical protein